jgi:hypothetical protein
MRQLPTSFTGIENWSTSGVDRSHEELGSVTLISIYVTGLTNGIGCEKRRNSISQSRSGCSEEDALKSSQT